MTPELAPGMLLGQAYRLEGPLYQGSRTEVWSALELSTGREVAIKSLRPQNADDPDAVARWQREVGVAERLGGEHVARTFAVEAFDGGPPRIVMERLNGMTLAKLLETRGRLPEAVAADYLVQACKAVVAAHAIGILHRDLTPENLFLAARPGGGEIVKVLDFGLSKLDMGSPRWTNQHEVLGSPHHISPEQLTSQEVDARSDVWSLGTCLYELVAGRRAFDGRALRQVVMQVLEGEPPPLSQLGVSSELERIVHKCLAKRPPDRFQSVASLEQALDAFLGRAPAAAAPRAAIASSGGTPAGVWVALAVAGALAIGGALFYVFR